MVTDAVIFDFDDTLVQTNCIFELAREKFFAVMASYGCHDRAAMDTFLNQTDIRHVLSRGYMAKECFPHALRDAYRHFIAASGREADAATARLMEDIGWQVYTVPPCLIEGAVEVLQALQGKTRLFLLTQGDADVQQRRLAMSGLLEYFADYRIVRNKDEQAFLDFTADMNIDRASSWMIGNSLRSDINPALKIGMKAIHYQMPAWDFEFEEPIGNYTSVEKLIDILEVLRL